MAVAAVPPPNDKTWWRRTELVFPKPQVFASNNLLMCHHPITAMHREIGVLSRFCASPKNRHLSTVSATGFQLKLKELAHHLGLI